jgi:porin-like protein
VVSVRSLARWLGSPTSFPTTPPTIGGFNASLSYSPDANTEGAGFTGTDQARESVWGITGRYTASALRAQVDWARRSNVGLVTDRDNTGLKVGLG